MTQKYYISGRQTGKTHALIEWALAAPDDRVVVCHSVGECNRLARQGVQAYSYNHMRRNMILGGDKIVGIDNLDLYIQATLPREFRARGNEIGYLTATGQSIELPF